MKPPATPIQYPRQLKARNHYSIDKQRMTPEFGSNQRGREEVSSPIQDRYARGDEDDVDQRLVTLPDLCCQLARQAVNWSKVGGAQVEDQSVVISDCYKVVKNGNLI